MICTGTGALTSRLSSCTVLIALLSRTILFDSSFTGRPLLIAAIGSLRALREDRCVKVFKGIGMHGKCSKNQVQGLEVPTKVGSLQIWWSTCDSARHGPWTNHAIATAWGGHAPNDDEQKRLHNSALDECASCFSFSVPVVIVFFAFLIKGIFCRASYFAATIDSSKWFRLYGKLDALAVERKREKNSRMSSPKSSPHHFRFLSYLSYKVIVIVIGCNKRCLILNCKGYTG